MVRLLVSKVAARSSARCLPFPCSSSTMANRRSVRFIYLFSLLYLHEASLRQCFQTEHLLQIIPGIRQWHVVVAYLTWACVNDRLVDSWQPGIMPKATYQTVMLCICKKSCRQATHITS